jgi:hypothetical protein
MKHSLMMSSQSFKRNNIVEYEIDERFEEKSILNLGWENWVSYLKITLANCRQIWYRYV